MPEGKNYPYLVVEKWENDKPIVVTDHMTFSGAMLAAKQVAITTNDIGIVYQPIGYYEKETQPVRWNEL